MISSELQVDAAGGRSDSHGTPRSVSGRSVDFVGKACVGIHVEYVIRPFIHRNRSEGTEGDREKSITPYNQTARNGLQ